MICIPKIEPFSSVILNICEKYNELPTLPTGVKIFNQLINHTRYKWFLKKINDGTIEIYQKNCVNNREQNYIVI